MILDNVNDTARMATVYSNKPYPKPRRSAPKVKTGCGTCRIRRVKCDEAKPICQRCIKFGVDCDGYLPITKPKSKPLHKSKSPSSPTSSNHFPTTTVTKPKPQQLIFQSSLSNLPFATIEEYQYFTLFCTRTGYDIFPTFDSGNTRQRLLESSLSNPSIMHAIVALGALDKTNEVAQQFSNLSISSSSSSPSSTYSHSPQMERDISPTHHHQQALLQYSEAIKHSSLTTESQDLRTILLTSLLILAFESWTGNMSLAVSQVHTSIRLIQSYHSSHILSNTQSPPEPIPKTCPNQKFLPLSPNPYEIEDDLIQIFCRLAVQHSFFSDGHSKELHTLLGVEGPTFTRTMPGEFRDVYEAGKYYNGIIRRGVYLITTHSAYLGPDRDEGVDTEFWKWALKEQEEIQRDVWRFNSAFAPVLEKIDRKRVEGESGTAEDKKERHYSLFIQMSLAVGYCGLSTHLAPDEGIHDQYNHVYQKVVDLAKLVLKEFPGGDGEERAGDNSGAGGVGEQRAEGINVSDHDCDGGVRKGRGGKFSFDTRIIVPLWVVGLKCRHPGIRREAIGILVRNPRREGIWDSVFAGSVLGWVMKVEEEFFG